MLAVCYRRRCAASFGDRILGDVPPPGLSDEEQPTSVQDSDLAQS